MRQTLHAINRALEIIAGAQDKIGPSWAAKDKMRKPKILDLFCGAGGCAVGYSRAGFDVVGVDLEHMRDYPFDFVQGDALEYVAANWQKFDAIHASPPCQAYSEMQKIWKNKTEHPDLIVPTRAALLSTGLPFVIENVVGAPLRADLLLCGTMFGLRIIRHRIFECSFPVDFMLPACNHADVYDPWHGKKDVNKFRSAMGIDWMRDGGGGKRKGTLSQAVPPAYTEYIGKQLRAHIVCAESAPENASEARLTAYNSAMPGGGTAPNLRSANFGIAQTVVCNCRATIQVGAAGGKSK